MFWTVSKKSSATQKAARFIVPLHRSNRTGALWEPHGIGSIGSTELIQQSLGKIRVVAAGKICLTRSGADQATVRALQRGDTLWVSLSQLISWCQLVAPNERTCFKLGGDLEGFAVDFSFEFL